MRRSVYLLLFGASACMTAASPPLHTVTTQFDPASVQWAARDGTNAISGNALLRTVGGEVRTCAGFVVNLIPESPYSTERMTATFGWLERGFRSVDQPIQLSGEAPGYGDTIRSTRCDAQGDFSFNLVPDGTYYVTAFVVWQVPGRYFSSNQGGVLMERVAVAGGQTKRIVLTR